MQTYRPQAHGTVDEEDNLKKISKNPSKKLSMNVKIQVITMQNLLD
jgi:hypothetical protein